MGVSADGRLLATVRSSLRVPFVLVWALDPELLLRFARTGVTRALSVVECVRFLQRCWRVGRYPWVVAPGLMIGANPCVKLKWPSNYAAMRRLRTNSTELSSWV